MATTYAPDATLRDVKRFPADLAYDQSTYFGRFRHFLSMTDPATLLTSPTRLAASEALLKRVSDKAENWESTRVVDYMDASKRVRAIVHPDTQKPILLPFRFSAYILMNFLNLCGMLHPSQQTPLRAMFWQFSNQTYNVGFNYCNGSGKDGLPMHELFTGYCVATLTACGLSYGLSKLAAPASSSLSSATSAAPPSARQRFLQLIIPYTAVACANIANLAVIRFRDVVRGIPVQDVETGEYLCGGEPSPRAGRLAVAQVALSRVMIPIPLMLLPPLFLNFLFDPVKGVPFFAQRQKALFMPVNVVTLVAVLTLALPLSIAVFPQQMVVPASWLEERYQRVTDSNGNNIQSVTFNKGL
ncbi:sideroflexin-like [Bactrocera neohumeralis]|uniref:sideroflexin-like n=1 Tax=Bactrocera neohumeralis TaxID=98809 RepID=UPI00216670D5|nr:sideroflexin-like [Bactrocera neohumeralis]